MTPDQRSRRRASPPTPARTRLAPSPVRRSPSSDDVHDVVYFRRHRDDDPTEHLPGREFLRSTCPPKVRATMVAVLAAVAAAPPKRFVGGGYWEAMKEELAGWFEVRVDGPKRHHYRLYCLLDYDAVNSGQDKPLLVIVCGLDKPFRSVLTKADYVGVRLLGDEYRSRNPRSLG